MPRTSPFAPLLPLLLLLVTTARPSLATSYSLLKSYAGSSFFSTSDWTYYGAYDNLTLGDVIWVNETVATSASVPLTYVNDAGNAIIKVDNSSTVAYNYKRNSVRISSVDTLDVGSVWVLDALHVPYGCSVWPAFWSSSLSSTWPAGGEIDTFEGVNLQSTNRMALHTSSGCNLTQSTAAAPYTGSINSTDCYVADDDNNGCVVVDGNSTSYGEAFAKAGGGVWVTEMASEGIKIWFFSRSNVPASINSTSSSSIDTSALGEPAAFYSNAGCDIAEHFKAQNLIFDITLCGSWAGAAATLQSTGCPALTGTNTCYSTYVLDASNYDEAYFEIKSLRTYGSGSSSSSSSSTTSSAASARRWNNKLVAGISVASSVGMAIMSAAWVL